MLPQPIQSLINQFTKFPSVGPRQAARFVFHLLKRPEKDIKEFAQALIALKETSHCLLCYRSIEKTEPPLLCSICKNNKRDKTVICIVEKDTDIEAIEKTKRYNGLYHVLGLSETSFLDQGFRKLAHLDNLINRIKKSKDIKEIIIATSATTNGDTLSLYISRLLKPYSENIKITRLGRGLSTGSELEYMDDETLTNAFLNRK